MASAAEQLASNLNWGAIGKATELKKRLWFTVSALVVFRIGAYIPVPGVDPHALAEIFAHNAGGIAGLLDVFSGGSIGRMSILALSIMPYISASIIMQILTTVIPSLEALQKLNSPRMVATRRGKKVGDLLGRRDETTAEATA